MIRHWRASSRTRHSASNYFHISQSLLNFLGNFCRDRSTSRDTTTPDVFAHSRLCRKITTRNRLTLGAAELLPEPLRHSVSRVHGSVEFVNFFIEGIAIECH